MKPGLGCDLRFSPRKCAWDIPTSQSNSVLETWTQDFTQPIRANSLEARSWIGDKNAEALSGARGQSFRPRASRLDLKAEPCMPIGKNYGGEQYCSDCR